MGPPIQSEKENIYLSHKKIFCLSSFLLFVCLEEKGGSMYNVMPMTLYCYHTIQPPFSPIFFLLFCSLAKVSSMLSK